MCTYKTCLSGSESKVEGSLQGRSHVVIFVFRCSAGLGTCMGWISSGYGDDDGGEMVIQLH